MSGTSVRLPEGEVGMEVTRTAANRGVPSSDCYSNSKMDKLVPLKPARMIPADREDDMCVICDKRHSTDKCPDAIFLGPKDLAHVLFYMKIGHITAAHQFVRFRRKSCKECFGCGSPSHRLWRCPNMGDKLGHIPTKDLAAFHGKGNWRAIFSETKKLMCFACGLLDHKIDMCPLLQGVPREELYEVKQLYCENKPVDAHQLQQELCMKYPRQSTQQQEQADVGRHSVHLPAPFVSASAPPTHPPCSHGPSQASSAKPQPETDTETPGHSKPGGQCPDAASASEPALLGTGGHDITRAAKPDQDLPRVGQDPSLLVKTSSISGASPGHRACALCKTTADMLKNGKLRLCSRCRSVLYCGKACQKADWPSHKATCCKSLPST